MQKVTVDPDILKLKEDVKNLSNQVEKLSNQLDLSVARLDLKHNLNAQKILNLEKNALIITDY